MEEECVLVCVIDELMDFMIVQKAIQCEKYDSISLCVCLYSFVCKLLCHENNSIYPTCFLLCYVFEKHYLGDVCLHCIFQL